MRLNQMPETLSILIGEAIAKKIQLRQCLPQFSRFIIEEDNEDRHGRHLVLLRNLAEHLDRLRGDLFHQTVAFDITINDGSPRAIHT